MKPLVKTSKLITKDGFRAFSKREKEVFKLLIEEYKAEQISKMLKLDEKTVCTYKLRLLKKIGAKTIIGLYVYNQRYNIVEANDMFLFKKADVKKI